MVTSDDPLAPARALYAAGHARAAIEAVDRLLAGDHCPPGAFLLRSQCWSQFNDLESTLLALHAAEAERVLDPTTPGLAEHVAALTARLTAAGPTRPAERPWSTALDANTLRHLEVCSQRHTYRSVPMVKNVFDLALYPTLLWDVRPRTIIEIGSYYGGSALWMADLTAAYGLDTRIVSVDILKVWTARHERVTFVTGSGRDLAAVLPDAVLDRLPRPWLVIEDADHSYETTTAVLNHFHPRLHPGEYVVVEDTATSPPALAGLRQFLAEHPDDYAVDSRYCDFFGTNVTWCVNGFLRRR